MSLTDGGCQGAKSAQIWKMLWEMAVLPLILYIRIKGEDIKGVRSNPLVIGKGGGRKQNRGGGANLWDWVKNKMNWTHTSFTLVGIEQLRVNY